MGKSKQLIDLVSVGPATLADFSRLGIKSVAMLSKQEAHALFQKLCRITNVKHDPCVEDVFAAAIAQAKNPDLAEEQKRWTYWSAIRKKRPVRCEWVNLGNNDYVQYHDSEWGVPVHDDKVHFEFLILEGAQAGLSWETILKRRAAYEEAFAGFDWKKVANFNQEKIDNLLTSSAIIRNRAKIQSAINNAQAFERVREEFGSFNDYIWQFVNATPLQPNQKMSSKIATTCAEAELMSRDLKKRGFSFVGPTIMYAYMQATGLINDHSPRCFRHKELASY